jgi:hypothetical protein
MKFRAAGFALFLGATVAMLAASNINCSVLQALAGDGGGATGGDGGGVVAGGDGGGMMGGTANVTVTINCMGDACGKMGTIVGRVKACGTGGMVHKSATLAGQTTTMGTPIMLTIDAVPVGMNCLRVYLDVNNNNMQDMGDAVPATDELNIDVTAMGATATVDLTMVKP